MGQDLSKKRLGSLQMYNRGACTNNNMCKNLISKGMYVSPSATCNKNVCNCGRGFKQLDGRCCKDIIYDKKQNKYVCVKIEKQSCPNDHTCKNFDFNERKFTCPDAKCTKDGCDCGSCKRFEGTCCKDIIYDTRSNEYKCVELSGYGYPKPYQTSYQEQYPAPYQS
jgi:hypothetical protein